MKRASAIGLSLAAAGSAFLAYRLSHLPQSPARVASPQVNATQRDQNLWQYVYNPARLQILNPRSSPAPARSGRLRYRRLSDYSASLLR